MTSPPAAHPEKRPRLGNGPQVINPCDDGKTGAYAPELDRIRNSTTQLAFLQAQLAATEALCSAYEDELDSLSEQLVAAKSSLLRSGQAVWKEEPQTAMLGKRRLESMPSCDGGGGGGDDDVDTFSDIEEEILLTDIPEAEVPQLAGRQQTQPAGPSDAGSPQAAGAALPGAGTSAGAGTLEAPSPSGPQAQRGAQPGSSGGGGGPGGVSSPPGPGEVAAGGGDEGVLAAEARARMETLEATCSAVAQDDMEAQGAVACLAGRTGKYYLRGIVVTLGRASDTKGDVDVDLTPEEGPPRTRAEAAGAGAGAAGGAGATTGGAAVGAAAGAGGTQAVQAAAAGAAGGGGGGGGGHRVSRRQALVRLGADGQFRLVNMGRQPVMVNDVAVDQNHTVTLPHLSLLEVGGVRLLFMANLAAVARVVRRSAALAL